MLTRNADLIRRLNILLGLTSYQVEIASMTETNWDTLRDDLYWAILAEKGPIPKDTVFEAAATAQGVRAAQEGLRGQLYQLRHAEPVRGPLLLENYPFFELAKQRVYLLVDDKGFFPRLVSEDFPTMAYNTLSLLIRELKLKPSDFLTCAHEKCARVFVPLRKPHAKTKKHFCSQRCGNIVSARASRKSKAEELRERSHKAYKKKVEKLQGKPTRVERRPRKPKPKKRHKNRRAFIVDGPISLRGWLKKRQLKNKTRQLIWRAKD